MKVKILDSIVVVRKALVIIGSLLAMILPMLRVAVSVATGTDTRNEQWVVVACDRFTTSVVATATFECDMLGIRVSVRTVLVKRVLLTLIVHLLWVLWCCVLVYYSSSVKLVAAVVTNRGRCSDLVKVLSTDMFISVVGIAVTLTLSLSCRLVPSGWLGCIVSSLCVTCSRLLWKQRIIVIRALRRIVRLTISFRQLYLKKKLVSVRRVESETGRNLASVRISVSRTMTRTLTWVGGWCAVCWLVGVCGLTD